MLCCSSDFILAAACIMERLSMCHRKRKSHFFVRKWRNTVYGRLMKPYYGSHTLSRDAFFSIVFILCSQTRALLIKEVRLGKTENRAHQRVEPRSEAGFWDTKGSAEPDWLLKGAWFASVCAHACGGMERPEVDTGCPSYHSLLCSLRQGLVLKPEHSDPRLSG